VLVVLIVTAFRKAGVTGKEFARLQKDVERLVRGNERTAGRRTETLYQGTQRRGEDDKISIAATQSAASDCPVFRTENRDSREIMRARLRQRKCGRLS